MQQQDVGDDPVLDQIALFDRYGEIIFAYIRVHTSSREDAEDLTLEVFTAAIEQNNLSALSDDTTQLAWLKRVARNKLIDHYRRLQRRPAVSLDSFVETMLDEAATPEEVALQREQHNELRTYVHDLPPFQQLLLRLRYGNGLRCSEIAVMVNKRENTVRQLLSRTIRSLRSRYQPMGDAE